MYVVKESETHRYYFIDDTQDWLLKKLLDIHLETGANLPTNKLMGEILNNDCKTILNSLQQSRAPVEWAGEETR